MKSFMKRCRHGIISGVLITFFTGYALLDVFVIPRNYGKADVPSAGLSISKSGEGETETAEAAVQTGTPFVTDRSYRDENISVVITQYRVNDTDVYAADVTVSSPEYLFSAFAKDTYGRNVKETVSDTAGRVDAILAVNGDFYGSRTGGYVIRNGILYRNVSAKNEDLVLYQSGKMEVVKESSVSAENLLKDGAVQVWSFGPGLLKGGEITVSASQEVGKAKASNPRTGGPATTTASPCMNWHSFCRRSARRPLIISTAADHPPWSLWERSSTIPPQTAETHRKGA